MTYKSISLAILSSLFKLFLHNVGNSQDIFPVFFTMFTLSAKGV